MQIEAYQKRLQDEELDEDMASDIGNDHFFLEALHKDLLRAIKDDFAKTINNNVASSWLGVRGGV